MNTAVKVKFKSWLKQKRSNFRSKFISKITAFPKTSLNIKLSHVAAFGLKNAGDLLLPITLKDLFHTQAGLIPWQNIHVHQIVNESILRKINKSSGLIIGGGGLFLKDTNKNDLSGWQWSCSLVALSKIKVPIALFAVGYNRFRNQADFDPIFTDHLNKLAEKLVALLLREIEVETERTGR